MTDAIFNVETIGSQPNWWTGIIVADESWIGNQQTKKWADVNTIPGWGARYKVRIVGHHPENKNILPDYDLELCEVLYPVTSGTGHAASYQTSNLRQGSVVFGIFKDNESKDPLILGCIGNNDQTYLNPTGQPDNGGFDSFSGFSLSSPIVNIPASSVRSLEQANGTPVVDIGTSSNVVIESNTPNTTVQQTTADVIEAKDQNEETPIASPEKCEKVPLGQIQKDIKNLILDLEEYRKSNWLTNLNSKYQKFAGIANTSSVGIGTTNRKFSDEPVTWIRERISMVAKAVAGKVKNIINIIQEYIETKIENAAKDFYYLIFPNQRDKLKKAVETSKDLLSCLFRKIIKNLIKIVEQLLYSIFDKFINTPLCAVETIIGALIGKLTGLINSALDSILNPISTLINAAISLQNDIIGFVIEVLTFLSCDEEPECSSVDTWSIKKGPSKTPSINLDGLINSVKKFAGSVSSAVDPNNFNFDLDFSDIFDDICDVDAILCGPPTVEFFGGGGSGARGNAIVGAFGEIMGVDIITPGSGYSSAPIVNLVDACGKGKSAVAKSKIRTDNTGINSTNSGIGTTESNSGSGGGTGDAGTEGAGTGGSGTGGAGGAGIGGDTGGGSGVISVIIEDPGTGYLPRPNGDLGGDGRTWADKNQTIVKRSDLSFDNPYNPGDVITIKPGDKIKIPPGSSLDINNQPVPGGTYYNVPISTTIIAPYREDGDDVTDQNNYASLGTGQYPVILYLCGIEILNSGFNYSEGDEVVIIPNQGASATAKFGKFGRVESVQITSEGEGFKQFPLIYIRSKTGYNAKLTPRFCINRVSEDALKEPQIQDKIISVIDCVGKYPQSTFFNVPR